MTTGIDFAGLLVFGCFLNMAFLASTGGKQHKSGKQRIKQDSFHYD